MSEPKMVSSSWPTASKEHQCYWCRTAITPGTRYRYEAWADDGRIDAIKMHSECLLAFHQWVEDYDLQPGDSFDPWEGEDRPFRGGYVDQEGVRYGTPQGQA